MVSTAAGEPGGRKILVADDQIHIVRLIQVNLERNGFPRVLPAYDGEEALEKVRREKPDLIICDDLMPMKDGFQLLRDLRAEPETRHLPFILFHSRAAAFSWNEPWTEVVQRVMTKPFSPGELVDTVRSVLDSAGPIPEAAIIQFLDTDPSAPYKAYQERGTRPGVWWNWIPRFWKRDREERA